MVQTPWGDIPASKMNAEQKRWYNRERQRRYLATEKGKANRNERRARFAAAHPDRERENNRKQAAKYRARQRAARPDSRRGALPLAPLPLPPVHAWTQAERDAINRANRALRNAARKAERAAKKAIRSPAKKRQPMSRKDVAPGFSWRQTMRKFLG